MGNVKRFKSNFGAEGLITSAQYITEFICNRAYQKVNPNCNLPDLFWKDKGRAKHFVFQITIITKLLKKYNAEVILKVLREEEWVDNATILKNSNKVKQKLTSYNKVFMINAKKEKKETIKGKVDKLPNKRSGQTNIFNKLKRLDNE